MFSSTFPYAAYDMMYDLYEVKEHHSCMAWCSISEFGWEVNERQVNIRWKPATPDGNLENITVVVSLDIHQDVVPVKKPRIEVYWSLFRL